MPSVYDLKPRFQQLLRPAMEELHRRAVTPNQVTLAALAGSVVVGLLLSFAAALPALLFLLPVWLFARMALNAIDGMLAREKNLTSRTGAVLNEVGDVLSDFALYVPLAFFTAPALWPVVLFTAGLVLTEFCGVLSQALGASRQYQGPMGKSDRAFVIGALGLATPLWPGVVAAWPWLFLLFLVLEIRTCSNRLQAALRELPQ